MAATFVCSVALLLVRSFLTSVVSQSVGYSDNHFLSAWLIFINKLSVVRKIKACLHVMRFSCFFLISFCYACAILLATLLINHFELLVILK